MIDPKTLDLSQLPSKVIDEKRDLPSSAGIYFAIDSCGIIQYIGQSINIKQRWLSHHRIVDLQNVDGVKIAYLLIDDLSLLDEIERALIDWFAPFLNGRSSHSLDLLGFYKTRSSKIVSGVRQARLLKNMSQNELSRKMGMSLMNLQRIESNRVKSIPFDTLDKLCDVLNCEVAELLIRASKIEQN